MEVSPVSLSTYTFLSCNCRKHKEKPFLQKIVPCPPAYPFLSPTLAILDTVLSEETHPSVLPLRLPRNPHKLRQPLAPRRTHRPSPLPSSSTNAPNARRARRLRAQCLVRLRRHRLPRPPVHQAANNRLRSNRQPRRPTRMALRETARLDRLVPVDRRRDPDLGLHLLLQHRRARGEPAHLLRVQARRNGP